MNENTPAAWANAIAERVNCYGIGLWLPTLQAWLGVEPEAWLSDQASTPLDIVASARGVVLRMRPLPSLTTTPAPFRNQHWVLEDALFDGAAARERPSVCALPFGLDPVAETPASARLKLHTDDIVVGKGEAKQRMSFFLDDARIVELSFGQDMTGIEQLRVVRLGAEQMREGF